MSTRYNTGNPIESTDVRDMSDNAKNFDEFANSTSNEFIDRFGVKRKTIYWMNSQFESQILNMGFTCVGTFATGATLTNPRQTLLWDVADGGDGQEYGWSGTFSKIVPPGSTPNTTGGIAVGAWMSRFDPELRIMVRESIRRSYAEAGYNLVAGSFEAGGTLVNANDALLQERTGKAYAGPAGTVAAGTDPASVGFVDVSGALLRNQLTKNAAVVLTLDQLSSGLAKIGDVVGVSERPGAKFLIESGTTPNGYTKLDAGFGRLAVMQYGNVVKAAWFGAVTNSAGVRETETTAALNFMFSLAANKAGITIELDGRYYTNAELVLPLCVDRAVYELPMLSIKGNNSLISHSHTGNGVVVETSSSIGTRNYAIEIADLYINNRGQLWKGVGLLIKGSFSALINRVVSSRHEYEFDVFCTSEITFRKCIAHTTSTGIRGNQLANPYGVDDNDYSAIIYDQFVCFGYEKYAIFSNGGGASRHIGGSIAAPGWAARSAIQYAGDFRDVTIDGVLVESQHPLSEGVFSFVGVGLKRSIHLKGCVHQVVGAPPSTHVVAYDVENITIEDFPFSVQGNVYGDIRYVHIDGAKVVNLVNNARSLEYLNKVDLYNVDNVYVDNYQVIEPNPKLLTKKANGEPVGLYTEGTWSNTPVTDNSGKSAASCSVAYCRLYQAEWNYYVNGKIPFMSVAKILPTSSVITVQAKDGANTRGLIQSPGVVGKWKTQFFVFYSSSIPVASTTVLGIRYSGISAVSFVGMLKNDNSYNPQLHVSPGDVAGITGWPQYKTIYNSDAGSPVGWVPTAAGIKTLG